MDCTEQESFLFTEDIWKKLERVDKDLQSALENRLKGVPVTPGRDTPVVIPDDLPPKKGLSYQEGQARMLHDLASIELQALELGLRTLIEFPDAPDAFREELARVTASEATHLRLCLEAMQDLGNPWGHVPVHVALWQAVDPNESLLDRILVVHRYLEGSGLDAGETLLRRLSGVKESPAHKVVDQIVREEVDHVAFGSRWYQEICRQENLDASLDFETRFQSVLHRVPKRIEKLSWDLRKKAGFTDGELVFLEKHRESIQKFQKSAKDLPGVEKVEPVLALS